MPYFRILLVKAKAMPSEYPRATRGAVARIRLQSTARRLAISQRLRERGRRFTKQGMSGWRDQRKVCPAILTTIHEAGLCYRHFLRRLPHQFRKKRPRQGAKTTQASTSAARRRVIAASSSHHVASAGVVSTLVSWRSISGVSMAHHRPRGPGHRWVDVT